MKPSIVVSSRPSPFLITGLAISPMLVTGSEGRIQRREFGELEKRGIEVRKNRAIEIRGQLYSEAK